MKFSALDIESTDVTDEYSSILGILINHRSNVYREPYYVPLQPKWQHFVDFVGMIIGDKPTQMKYKDDDNDMISIDSDLEWNEALNFVKKNENRLEVFVVEFVTLRNDEDGGPVQFATKEDKNMTIEDKTETVEEARAMDLEKEVKDKEKCLNDQTQPPKWFTDYMEKYKGDLVAEVVKKVNRRFQKCLIGERTTNESLNDLDAKSFSDSDRGAVPKTHAEKILFVTDDRSRVSTEGTISSVRQLALGLDRMSTCKVSATTADLPIHRGIHCQMCHKEIIGVRYKCGNCADFDLCAACEGSNQCHFPEHVFIKLRKPAVEVGFRKKTGKAAPLLKHNLYSKDDQYGSGRCNKRKLTSHKWEKTIQKYFGNASNSYLRDYQFLPREIFVSKLSHSILDPLKPIKLTMDAEFVNDETVPDGTNFTPGVRFTKAWCVVNSGSRPWTHETTLKCLWGTKGFVPNSMEVAVPPLFPQQRGKIYVDYFSPITSGYYESHWNFVHKGHLFGHRIWCSIKVTNRDMDRSEELVRRCPVEIQEPENGEKQIIDELQMFECDRVNDLAPDDVQVRKTLFLSQTATPNNTPFVLSPPKSPEPSDVDKDMELHSLPDSDDSVTNEDVQAISDSEITSVKSLISSDSDSEFVLVPMPPCFNFVTATTNSSDLESPPAYSEKSGLRSSSSSSVIFVASDGEEATSRTDLGEVVCDHSYAKPLASPTVSDAAEILCSSSTSTVYEEPTNNSDNNISNVGTSIMRCLSLETGEVSNLTLSDKDEENNNHSSGSDISQDSRTENPNVSSVGNEVEVESGEPVLLQPEPQPRIESTDSVSANEADRVVNVLPDSLIMAAATILNSARTAFSAMQWVPSPPSDLPSSVLHPQTTGIRLTETTSPTTNNERPTLPSSQSSINSLLCEMGFCNAKLNAELIEKHVGNLEKILDELVRHNDSDWYAHRH